MFRASSRAPTGAGASSVTRVAAMVGNRSSVGRLRLSRPARATETGAEKGSPLKVPVTMDQQLEAQLERLRIAEKENAELKRMIDELEDELDIDFEVSEEDRPARGGWGGVQTLGPHSRGSPPPTCRATAETTFADDLLPPLPPSTS